MSGLIHIGVKNIMDSIIKLDNTTLWDMSKFVLQYIVNQIVNREGNSMGSSKITSAELASVGGYTQSLDTSGRSKGVAALL